MSFFFLNSLLVKKIGHFLARFSTMTSYPRDTIDWVATALYSTIVLLLKLWKQEVQCSAF